MNKEILVEKYDLVDSDIYSKIKSYQLDNIVKLSNSDINPLILQGMLKLIADTEKWRNEFKNEKKKELKNA